MSGIATIKLAGSLGHPSQKEGTHAPHFQVININTPMKLGAAIQDLENKHRLHLPREGVLILVNGIEANALDDLETIIRENDEVVLVPIFHGGLFP